LSIPVSFFDDEVMPVEENFTCSIETIDWIISDNETESELGNLQSGN
jgi:hypothetical protein